mmetsp:Transcript_15289/g.58193  ORF Transcript_15289/g.58193 Transcript_15289/m.58193 type:complete len:765 (+) Transcript_15289:212-2506(+)
MAAARARLRHDEVLSRVVQKSTEAWLKAEDDFSNELEELADEGYQAYTEMRGDQQEYEGMLRMRTTRAPSFRPVVVESLLGTKIVRVSAGYGHIMALSDSGRLFGAGYNDRGQLGLGHRINTAKFQQVRTFADRRVLQVVCGQQHTIARVESSTGAKESTLSEVFVWGNGVLGQLGLGRRGISKGRLVPHRLATLDDQNVIDIAAGANHSLALSDTGDVFFWGHTEYGQSGRTKSSAGDYEVGGHLKFYIPGKVEGFGSSHIKKIACGSTFSLALSESGHVYSFGWNESGVLGMGTSGRTALSPSRIPFLGPPHTPPCVDISCGHVHAFAVTDVRSAHLPMLRPLLGQPSGDVALVVKDGRNRALKSFLNDVKSKTGGAEPRKAEPVEEIFFAHSFILASRCEFFRDLILHARDAGSYLADADGKGVSVLDSAGGATTDAEEDCPKKILLELEEREWSKATVRAMLIYLYTEELICPPHRYHALRALAVRLGLEHLVYILSEADRSLDALAWRPIDQPEKESDPVESTFVRDLVKNVEVPSGADPTNLPGVPADVAFCIGVPELDFYLDSKAQADEPEVIEHLRTLLDVAKDEVDGDGRIVMYQAHKAVLRRIPYFHALMTGDFLESAENTSSDTFNVDVGSLLEDGLSISALRRFLSFVYSGSRAQVPDEDPNATMALAVVAGRFGAPSLVRLCEQQLLAFVGDDEENAAVVLEFASRYGLPRLQRLARKVLSDVDDDEEVSAHLALDAAREEGEGAVEEKKS